MAWLQLKIETAKADTDRIEEALELVGAGAIMMEDAADQPLFEPPLGTTPLWDATRIVALFTIDSDMDAILEFLNEHLEGGLPSTHRVEILEDQVWERAWMDHYHPMCFGERLWVVPSWTPPPRVRIPVSNWWPFARRRPPSGGFRHDRPRSWTGRECR